MDERVVRSVLRLLAALLMLVGLTLALQVSIELVGSSRMLGQAMNIPGLQLSELATEASLFGILKHLVLVLEGWLLFTFSPRLAELVVD